jgi:hypothetical protein
VLDCIVGSILSSIFSGEAESICSTVSDRDCVVHEIDIALCPLLIILDKAIVEVALGEIIGTVLIESYKKFRV